ncbi:MAG: CRISPR-associated CARF protein Csx1 [Thermoplasmatales archaeon]
MVERRIVISTLGDYSAYQEVNYSLKLPDSTITEKSSFSAAALAKMVNADSIVVFAPISLVVNDPSLQEGVSVKDLSHRLQLSIKEFLDKQLDSRIKKEIYVVPVKGKFLTKSNSKTLVEIKTGVGNFYVEVYRIVAEFLKNNRNCEVLVDTTHSLNFTTLDMVEATNLALRYIDASEPGEHQFTFEVYNSDPFIRGFDTPLYLNLTRREKINNRPQSISKIAGEVLYNLDLNYVKRALNKIGLRFDKTAQKIKKLAYAFLLGCLLFIGSYQETVKSLSSSLWEAIVGADGISRAENTLYSNGVIDLGAELERELPKIHAFLSSISSNEFSKLDKSTEISVLKSVSRSLVEPGSTLLKNELDLLCNKFEELPNEERKDVMLLSEIIDRRDAERVRGHSNCCLDKRNFVAHAGLEENVTWVEFKDEKIFLSYRDCLREVEKVLKA